VTVVTVDAAASRLRAHVEAAARAGAGEAPARLAARLLEAVTAVVPTAGGALWLTDPLTGLVVAGAVDRLAESAWHQLLAVESGRDWPRSFRRLAVTGAGASALTLRELDTAPVHASVLEPHGYADELRAVCRDGDIAWAALSLWRRPGSPAFERVDERLLDAVSATIGAALRDAVVAATEGGEPLLSMSACGRVVVEHGRVVEYDDRTAGLLDALAATPAGPRRRELLLARMSRTQRLSLVLGPCGGSWLTAHAVEDNQFLLTAASPADLFGAAVADSGLDHTELEAVRLLCGGLTDAEIAPEMRLPVDAVEELVATVCARLGVPGREGVAARVFAEHHAPGLGSVTVRTG
jgi:DNA-binding CsgD family transcriptional regulator